MGARRAGRIGWQGTASSTICTWTCENTMRRVPDVSGPPYPLGPSRRPAAAAQSYTQDSANTKDAPNATAETVTMVISLPRRSLAEGG